MNQLDTIEPDFKAKVVELLVKLKAQGIACAVTSGRRTIAEQNELFAQGRTKPGQMVTKAKGGQSPHNFGFAVDLCPYRPGTKQLWWNCPDDIWHVIHDTAEAMGLDSGYDWKFQDCPHIEDRGWRTAQAKWQAGLLEVA